MHRIVTSNSIFDDGNGFVLDLDVKDFNNMKCKE